MTLPDPLSATPNLGLVSLEANYRYPPTDAELLQFQRHMQVASVILCDATDGQLAVSNVVITQGESREQAADLWMQPDDGRSNVNIIPGLGNAAARAEMFHDDVNGGVLAHELVHYVLGLGDEYDEQRRWGGACGIGANFDSVATMDARNHTLTQANPAPMCGRFDANDRFVTAGGLGLCAQNADCGGGGDICYVDLASELSVDLNHDLKTGLGDPEMCPDNAQTSQVDVTVRVRNTDPIRAFNSTDYDSAEASAIAFVEVEVIDDIGDISCIPNDDLFAKSSIRLSLYLAHEAADAWTLYVGLDEQQLVDPPDGGQKTLTIIDAIAITVTPAVPGCGDNVVSAALGEECEATSAPIACTTLTGNLFATGGSAACRADTCTWNRSACQYPPLPFGAGSSCGNGVIDLFSSEQCEGTSTAACAVGGGTQSCTNCMNDPQLCTHTAAAPASVATNPAAPRLEISDLLSGASDIDIPLVITPSITLAASSVAATADGEGDCALQPSFAECARAYSNADDRFETSDHSLRFNGRSNWSVVLDNYPWMSAPADLPLADIPPECNRVVTFTGDLTGVEQVMVVVDVSGSMDTPVAEGSLETRIDYAREAVDLLATLREGTTAELGLVSFNSTANLDISVAALDAAQRTLFDNALDAYTPAGATSIGEGLFSGLAELQRVTAAGKDRIIYLVSDGHHNTGRTPAEAVAALKAEPAPIQVFSVPISDEANRDQLRDIAAQTGGSMLDAPTGDEVPGIFAEVAARSQGDAMIVPRISVPVAEGCCDDDLFDPDYYDHEIWSAVPESYEIPFLVDPGSERLDVVLTSRNADSSTWSPDVMLSGPDGTQILSGDPRLRVTQYYITVRVPLPAPGTWTLEIASSSGPQLQWVMASAANPTSDCFIGAPSRVSTGQTALITGDASYATSLDPDTADLEAIVLRPGGTASNVPLDREWGNDLVQGEFSAWTGRGTYTAFLRLRRRRSLAPAAG